MRSKTIKRLAILIAVVGLLGGIGFLVQRAQIKRLAHSVVEQADHAKKEGDLAKAELLLKGHLKNVPDDLDINFKYANLILEIAKTPMRQDEALGVYGGILKRDPGNTEVRRRLMELEFEMRRFESAQGELLILLGPGPLENKDGDLQFKLGRCYEEGGDSKNAEKYYQAAIKHNTSHWLEAYQSRAILLRERLDRPVDADAAIQAMVESDPKNYKVYLERGRYRQRSDIRGAGDDFQKALQLAEGKDKVDKVDIYLEIAKVLEKEKGQDAARKILEKELKDLPDSPALNEALALLELRANHVDKAIDILQQCLKTSPNLSRQRWILANILAQSGDNPKLAIQIEELKRASFSPVLLRFLTAYYNINKSEYASALQLLMPLQSELDRDPKLRAQVNSLLARCYNRLGDPEMQREAYLRNLRDNPADMQARLGWIGILIKQGETDRGIAEYEKLVGKVPQVRLPLARLLIARNRRRPVVNRDWSKVERLIADAAADSPESVEPSILQADLLLAQGKTPEVENLLKKARSKYPKSVEIRIAQISVVTSQSRFEEARKLLDEAQGQLGDLVDLRLARAQLAAAQKGPEVIAVLNKLAQNIDHFPKEDQHRLLDGLAAEHVRQKDLQGGSRVWSELAQQLPNNIELRLKLLNLAFEKDDEEEIKKNIQQIERIEGSEGLMGSYCQVRYLVLQAQRASQKGQQAVKEAKDKNTEADRLSSLKTFEESQKRAQELRTEARLLINQMMARRGGWSLIHLILAQLEEQELAPSQAGLDEKKRQEKLDSSINSYLRAIELGQHDLGIVSHVVQLLFMAGRNNEALELYNRSSLESQPGGDRLGLLASQQAFRTKDFRRAEEITRKALAANPADFEQRFWLAQMLLKNGRQADAESQIREGVELSKNDPMRWITLVRFLSDTKQPEKAANAFKEAQPNLARLAEPGASLALAECCELVGRAYEGGTGTDAVKKWYGDAKGWFEKAQAAKPHELSITRRLTDFFLQTRQINEAESQLKAVLKRGDKNADEIAWARRMLALTLISKGAPEPAREALALYEPITNTPEAPEDQRVLARVLDAQRSAEHRKRAIEIMNALVGKNPDGLEDRLLLAQLNELAGDWPRAREQYDELITRTESREDPETLNRRSGYLDQFIKGLIRHRQGRENQELTKAQELVDKLKRLKPDELPPLVLEVAINRAQGEFEKEAALKRAQNPAEKEAALKRAQNYVEKAAALIKAFANRPNLTMAKLATLADQAERLNELELAEKLQREVADKATTPRGKIELAAFLGRHNHVKEALDLYATLWPNTREPEVLTGLCLQAVLRPNNTVEPADIKRVSDWLTQALKQYPQSTTLMVSLANLHEHRGLYKEAEALYRRAIDQGDRNGVSHNNLAWLLALTDGGNRKDALEYVNRAIDLKGPIPDFLDTRGIVYLAAGENQRAITDLEKAVKGDPSPSKYFHLAEAYLQANKIADAKKNWEAANIKVWEQSGLHALEQTTYKKLLDELGMPSAPSN